MTIAFLIQAHADPTHLARLVERLKPHDVYVHLDAKTPLTDRWSGIDAHFVEPRVAVHWAGFSQVRGTMNTIRAALGSGRSYSKLVLISGACYPIKPPRDLAAKFDGDGGFNYIKYVDMRQSAHLSTLIDRPHLRDALHDGALLRLPQGKLVNKAASRMLEKVLSLRRPVWPFDRTPYHGSNWWALTPEAAAFCLAEYDGDPRIAAVYSRAFASDEQVFHTLIGNSRFRDRSSGEIAFTGRGTYKAANLHIIHKSLGKYYTLEDFDEVAASDMFFVRKISTDRSGSLLDRIDRELL